MREYETYTLPQYAKAFFGKPITLVRLDDGRFQVTGHYCRRTFEAENVSDAREAIKRIAQYEDNLKDARITRHRNQGKDTKMDHSNDARKYSGEGQYKPTLNKRQSALGILIARISSRIDQPGCLGVSLTLEEATMIRDHLVDLGDAS